MNVNDNKLLLCQIIKIKWQKIHYLLHEVYNTKDKIDKYVCTTCHVIVPGLESRYILLHKANVSRLCCAVLGWVAL